MANTIEETKESITSDDTIYQKKVILHNDDYNSFDHVIECVMTICHKSQREAETITWEAHTNGKAVCYEGSLETCETVAQKMDNENLTVSVE